MPIVPQFTALLNALFPSTPLLAAPRPTLVLSAPRIAGLLSSSQPRIEIVRDPFGLEDLLSGLRLRSREEMDAELEALAQESRQRIAQVFEAFMARRKP